MHEAAIHGTQSSQSKIQPVRIGKMICLFEDQNINDNIIQTNI